MNKIQIKPLYEYKYILKYFYTNFILMHNIIFDNMKYK